MRLITIDPGAKTGWAFFIDGRLRGCGTWPIARMMREWCAPPQGALVLLEHPVLYPNDGNKKKANVPDNDVVRLGVRTGELGGRFFTGGAEIEYEYPRSWKGNIGKPAPGKQYIIEKRVMRVLDDEESKLIYSTMSARAKSPNDNMIDAVGLGLWKLGRKYLGEIA